MFGLLGVVLLARRAQLIPFARAERCLPWTIFFRAFSPVQFAFACLAWFAVEILCVKNQFVSTPPEICFHAFFLRAFASWWLILWRNVP
jgi:hypothetical protein